MPLSEEQCRTLAKDTASCTFQTRNLWIWSCICKYGRQKKGTREIDYLWFWQNINEGNTVYVNRIKADAFYQSAGLQLPMEGKRFINLFGYSIKTEEDLVKLKMKREAEAEATTARQGVSPESIPEAISSLSLAECSFLMEKEALLAQHKKWNPTYTIRTATKLAEQGINTEDIADTLKKYAPDIQNLPSADHRKKAAEKIATFASKAVCAEQTQQESTASR